MRLQGKGFVVWTGLLRSSLPILPKRCLTRLICFLDKSKGQQIKLEIFRNGKTLIKQIQLN